MLLFCIPYAGGSARIYRSWHKRLPAGVRVEPIELPGRGTRIRDRVLASQDALVTDLTRRIGHRLAGMPYAFFGHSLGALLAFETAHRLSDQHGYPPSHLFLAGHRAPHLPMREEPIHGLDDALFVERLRVLGGTPEDILNDVETMNVLMPTLRADFTVAERYEFRPRPPLHCDATVFGGTADVDVPLSDLAAWARHLAGRATIRMLPGDHFFLHTAEDVLLNQLSDELATLLARPSGAVPATTGPVASR